MAEKNDVDWHPSAEGQYWNEQGLNHLEGTNNKRFSIEDAVRCFEKAISLGDSAAAYNLLILQKEKLASSEIYSEETLYRNLLASGCIYETKSKEKAIPRPDPSISGIISIDIMKTTELLSKTRLRAETIVNILSGTTGNPDQLSFRDRALKARDSGKISNNEFKTLIEIWNVCSDTMHTGTATDIDQYAEKWARVLDRLENRIIESSSNQAK